MKSEDISYYDLMYRLSYLVRYSNVPRLHDESVAEHSFFVAAIVIQLRDTYEFNLGTALCIAISHDMPESRTNDISHETKRLFPEIKAILDKAEDSVLKELPNPSVLAIKEYRAEVSVESRIAHLADAIQCFQYSKNEKELGNHGYMSSVFKGSQQRIRYLEARLVEYKL